MKQNLLKYQIIILLLLIAVGSFGQQDPMFTQYMNNPQLINPAYTGSQEKMNFNGIFRKQWAGSNIPWTPTTTSLSVSAPVWGNKVGVGLDFMHDDVGPMSLTGIYTDYAYHIRFKNGAKLALGLKGGFSYYQENISDLITYEYDYFAALYSVTDKTLFNVGVGSYYYTDKFFVGASFPTLIRNNLVEVDNTSMNLILSKKEQHLFLTTGYSIELNKLFKLKPTAMLRMVDGAPISFELTGTAVFADKVSFGLMYRFGDAAAIHARFEVQEGFEIGYSYDLTTSSLSPFNEGTHEIFFSYTFKQRGKRVLSPRYFDQNN